MPGPTRLPVLFGAGFSLLRGVPIEPSAENI
jgi:hypothetical protein